MDNNSNRKDYEEYFSQIEKSLYQKKEKTPSRANSVRKPLVKKKTTVLNVPLLIKAAAIVLAVILVFVFAFSLKSCKKTDKKSAHDKTVAVTAEKEEKKPIFAKEDDGLIKLGEDINSKAVVFIDAVKNRIVAGKNMYEKMYPASTTKIMTLLVAVENIKDYSDTFKMTNTITDPLYRAEATVAGFSAGEVINMKDLIYGTILPSGGDAALGLAVKISGSEQEFVKLMNEKAKELKLTSTHFTNCTGLFDADHYTTAYDMSAILREAMQNPLCKEVLSTYKYTTSRTEKHPDGIELESTMFKYMYGTEPENATILGGKTGYVAESGFCLASFGEGKNGKEYVCVTLSAPTRWPGIFDQINIYKKYTKENEK